MAAETMKICRDQVKIIQAISYDPIFEDERPGRHYSYYIGFEDEFGVACRLSPYFMSKFKAIQALANNDYSKEISVTTFPNGNKIYSTLNAIPTIEY